ncbi:MAG: PAS domain-containing protein [Ilumatobacteraceae bacterium]
MPRSRGTRSDRARQDNIEVIAEAIPHIVWLAAADGSTDYFNEQGTDYTGFGREANYGWGWVDLVHPADSDRARLGWEHATRTVTPFVLSYRIRRYDGAFRWHAFRALPVREPSGEIIRWIGTADDLDGLACHGEAARVERQARELRDLLHAVQPEDGERSDVVDSGVHAARVNRLLAMDNGTTAVSHAAGPEGENGSPRPPDRLASREVAVLRLLAAGYTNIEIANLLGFSLRSVESSRARLRRALGVRTRAELVRYALDAGFTDARAEPRRG